MLLIIQDLSKNGPSVMKDIIIRIEEMDILPGREQTKRLYSLTRSSMVRLISHGLVRCSEDKVYMITKKGETHLRARKFKNRT